MKIFIDTADIDEIRDAARKRTFGDARKQHASARTRGSGAQPQWLSQD